MWIWPLYLHINQKSDDDDDSVIMAGIGLAIPVMLPLEITAIVSGCMGACVKLVRRELVSKAQKHYEIKTIGESKLNSVKNLISNALNDGQISEQEFQMVLCDLDRYYDLKDQTHTKQSGLSEQEKKKLIEEGKSQALVLFKKKISDTKFCSVNLCLRMINPKISKYKKLNSLPVDLLIFFLKMCFFILPFMYAKSGGNWSTRFHCFQESKTFKELVPYDAKVCDDSIFLLNLTDRVLSLGNDKKIAKLPRGPSA